MCLISRIVVNNRHQRFKAKRKRTLYARTMLLYSVLPYGTDPQSTQEFQMADEGSRHTPQSSTRLLESQAVQTPRWGLLESRQRPQESEFSLEWCVGEVLTVSCCSIDDAIAVDTAVNVGAVHWEALVATILHLSSRTLRRR